MNDSQYDRVERVLRKLVLLFLTILIIVQILMQNESVRQFLSSVEKYEGKPYINSSIIQEDRKK